MEKFNVPLLASNPTESDWQYFIRQFGNYLTIVSATDAQKLPLFLNALGRDGTDIFDGLPEPKDTYDYAVDRFKGHFLNRTSVLLLRKQFYEARQQPNESVSDFACRLRREFPRIAYSEQPRTQCYATSSLSVFGMTDLARSCSRKMLLLLHSTLP
jgi:hypothetical protein